MNDNDLALDLSRDVHLAIPDSSRGTNRAGGPHFEEFSVTSPDSLRSVWIGDAADTPESVTWTAYDCGQVRPPVTEPVTAARAAIIEFLTHGD